MRTIRVAALLLAIILTACSPTSAALASRAPRE